MTLTTQAEVNNYPLQYSNADSISRLTIGYYPYTGETSKIKNLDSLYVIKYIANELSIRYNDSLTSLAGLENLTKVLGYIQITNNIALESIDGLSGLDSVGRFFNIHQNPALTSCAVNLICQILKEHPTDIYVTENGIGCSGSDEIALSCQLVCDCPPGISFNSQMKIDQFPGLYPDCHEIHGNVYIVDQVGPIMNLDSLININLINGNLDIRNNHLLSNLEGLDSLQMVMGRLDFYNNTALNTLSNLKNLKYCGTGLSIYSNNSLENLNGLDNLERADGYLDITSNKKLKSFESLSKVKYCAGLSIRSNDSLYEFNGLYELDSIRYGVLLFSNPSLASMHGLHSLKYIGLDLSTDINSLAGLDSLNTIGREFKIFQSRLENFTELPSIKSIGSLSITHCDSLRNFRGLEKIEYIESHISCVDNDSLSNFEGMEGLKSVGSFDIRSNNNLLNFMGLDSLVSVQHDFYISFNHNFQSFSGLKSLTSVGGDLTVRVSNSFNSYSGLDSLKSIGGNFDLISARGIANFYHLLNLQEIGGDMNIYLATVETFYGLTNLERIGGNFFVRSNQSLRSFTGVDQLSHIGKSFSILENDFLVSMDGLGSLDSIGLALGIGANNKLNDVSGLKLVKHMSTLSLQQNPELSECSILSFCNFINQSSPASYSISDNATGCNSDLEVLAACKSCPCVLTEENTWIGVASDGLWHNQFNWSQQSIPDPCDMVEIGISNTPIVLEENRTAECYTLSVAQGTTLLQEQGSVLQVNCADP